MMLEIQVQKPSRKQACVRFPNLVPRACLKNHFRNLQAPLCGIFYSHSVAVARYAYVFKAAHSNLYPACMV